MTSTIPIAALAATARPFDQAMTPPGQIFCDPDLYQQDLERIFRQQWLCVGHATRLTRPGDFFTVEAGNESVIVALDPDGNANAFLNVCRHRGTRVSSEPAGNCRGFLCPYHAWHYDLNGRLKAAPMMDDVAGFDRSDYPLVGVQLDTFLGFLFINFCDDAAPLASQFGDFPNLDRFGLPSLRRVARHEYLVEANWKLICENYHECYHCQNAHPQLHRISHYGDLSNDGFSGRHFIGGPMAMRAGFNTMTRSGNTERSPLAPGGDTLSVHYFNLLPNFLLSIAPDYVLTHHIWPRGPEQAFVESEWFFSAEQIAQPDFDPADAVEFWDTTNRQDWALCENAQKGLRSAGHRPGRYQSGEDCAHRFDQWYVKSMFPELA
jgi:Rieske 2Fe-2S family protein